MGLAGYRTANAHVGVGGCRTANAHVGVAGYRTASAHVGVGSSRSGMIDHVSAVITHERQRIRALIAARDPELLDAAAEVDRSLLDWALAQTPRQRLDACSSATRALAGFRRGTSTDR